MEERQVAEQVAIATTTLYRPEDTVRPPLALAMVRDAQDQGYKVVVVDSGSPDEFLKELEATGASLIHYSEGSMGKQRRLAFEQASSLEDIVAWTEPEKLPYVRELWKTALPLLEGRADITVPSRPDLKSYPLLQQYVEHAGNAIWRLLTGAPLDVWFGPRTWRGDMTHYFTGYDGRHGDAWESIFIPLVDALADSRRIASVPVVYSHPPEQTRQEYYDTSFAVKRLGQLYTISRAVAAAVNEHRR